MWCFKNVGQITIIGACFDYDGIVFNEANDPVRGSVNEPSALPYSQLSEDATGFAAKLKLGDTIRLDIFWGNSNG